ANQLRLHEGAIDQGRVTIENPPVVMLKVAGVLRNMGIEYSQETPFRYRCVRHKRKSTSDAIYGDVSVDKGDEVRFYVELTRLEKLQGTYSLDIRRLKGSLGGYQVVYETLRE
ncbi:hypothetical protein CALCODRAFT_420525, partial [Calocera cornea HHB12733]